MSKGATAVHDAQIKVRLGTYLRDARKRRGLRLADVANAIGRTTQFVCDIEKGRRGGRWLQAQTVAMWAGYLEIPVSTIADLQRGSVDDWLQSEDSQRYRDYLRILRNREHSRMLLNAVTALNDVVQQAQNPKLTMHDARELLSIVSESVGKIESALAYK
jgi:transcriptional regulator with XRE-family HTH domain